MAQMPHYSADDFPGDLAAGLRAALATGLVCGPAVWWASLWYLRRTYPGHSELAPFAVVAGVVNAVLIGFLAFAFTFAVRLWRRERAERRQSDDALRSALNDIAAEREDGNPAPRGR